MTAVTIFMTQEHIMDVSADRLKSDSFKNRALKNYISPWATVKARNFNRLTARVIFVK